MSDARSDLEVERWECVAGGGASALLRLTGAWPDGERPSPGASSLLVETSDGARRHSPLPDPAAEDPDGAWRVAFAVDAGVLQGPATYRLTVPHRPPQQLGPPAGHGAPAQDALVEEAGAAAQAGPRGPLAALIGLMSRRPLAPRAAERLQGASGRPQDITLAPRAEAAGAELRAERDRRIGLETAVLMWRDLERKERTERDRRIGLETAVLMWRDLERKERTGREAAEAELTASAERAGAEAQLARQRVEDLEARVAELTHALDFESGQHRAVVESERKLNAQLAEREKELQNALAKAERRGVKIAALNQDLAQAKAKQPLRMRRRIEALTQESARVKAEFEATRVQLAEGEYARARLQQELARQEQRLEAAATAGSRERDAFEAVQARLEAELAASLSERVALTASIEELRIEQAATVDALSQARGDVERLEAESRRSGAELEQAGATAASLAQARDHALSRVATLEQALLEADERAAALRADREETATSMEQLRLEHVATVDALGRFEREAQELAQALEAERADSQALTGRIQELEAALRRSDAQLEDTRASDASLTEARDQAVARAAALDETLLEADERSRALREARDELAASMGQLHLEHVATADALAKSKRHVQALEDQRLALGAELEAALSRGDGYEARPAPEAEASPPRAPDAMALDGLKGLDAPALEKLRSEALRGRELATDIEERAVRLLDAVAAQA